MPKGADWNKKLFDGLNALAESAFPKVCQNCGKRYETADQFISETKNINQGKTGLKQSYDDDDNTIVELYRNCSCGSTLMDFFTDRRDMSEKGLARREKFSELLEYLVAEGLDRNTAREELLIVLRGGKSELLKNFKPPSSSSK